MKIYQSEKAIASLITGNNKVTWDSEVRFDPSVAKNSDIVNFAKAQHVESFDLYPFSCILASTVLNSNSDYFSKEQLWTAKNTIKNHPQNMNHDNENIVGHIISAGAYDFQGNKINDDTAVADLPLFDVAVSGVIYTHWLREERVDEVLQLIDKIESDKMFVSMECVFRDFDYILKSAQGEHVIVSRGEDTAHLSSHLRHYGGTGKYKDYTIGRVLKDIIFVGNAFTENPANKRSVIFHVDQSFVTNEKYVGLDLVENGVKASMENTMSDENQVSQADLDALQLKLDEALALVLSREEQIASVTSEKEKLTTEFQTLKEDFAQLQTRFDSISNELQDSTNKMVELQSQFESATAENDKETRKYKLMLKGFSEDEALKKVESFSTLSAEQWSLLVAELNPKTQTSVTVDEITETVSANHSEASLSTEEPEDTSAGEKFAQMQKQLSKMMRGK